jgi:F0F1-type ATP synthase delta subunit
MKAETFAQALYSLAQKDGADAKKLVTQLKTYLAESGRIKLLPSILQELRKIEAREAKLMPAVEVALEKDAAKALSEASVAGVTVSKATINPSLISGWRAMGNGKLYDNSAKRSLIEVYRKITT